MKNPSMSFHSTTKRLFQLKSFEEKLVKNQKNGFEKVETLTSMSLFWLHVFSKKKEMRKASCRHSERQFRSLRKKRVRYPCLELLWARNLTGGVETGRVFTTRNPKIVITE